MMSQLEIATITYWTASRAAARLMSRDLGLEGLFYLTRVKLFPKIAQRADARMKSVIDGQVSS